MCGDLFVAFDNWLNQHGNALAISLRIIERDLDMIRLEFAGITDAGIIVVRKQNMIVLLHHGTCWDTLMWLDCKPRVCAEGVFCRMCEPAERSIFPNHEALFTAHLFMPLAEWIKTKVSPIDANGLGAATAAVSGRCSWRTTDWATTS